MEDKEQKRSWAEILKHPTANMIIGFLLTGVLGTGITHYFSMQRQKEKEHAEMVAANKEIVSTLASLNAERLARAEMLLTALEEGDNESIGELRKMYKESELNWKTESAPVLMVARQVLPADRYYQFRDYMENQYRSRFLIPIGNCLKEAANAVGIGNNVSEILIACRAREHLDRAGKCNMALLDTLFEMAKGAIDEYGPEELEQQKKDYKKRISISCVELQSMSGKQ